MYKRILDSVQIEDFLATNRHLFFDSLKDAGNLTSYSEKVVENGVVIGSYDSSNNMVGIIIGYVNDFSSKIAYISVLLTIENGKGYGRNLVNVFCNYARDKKMKSVRLKVYNENECAIHLYSKLNFTIIDELENQRFLMEKKLASNT